MKKRTISTVSTLVLLLSACNSEFVPLEEKLPKEKVELATENNEDTGKENEQTSQSINLVNALKTIDIGMTKEQVVKIMGTNYKETSYMFEGEGGYSLMTPVPRINLDYSTGALVEDYVFENEVEDAVDIEGIHQKQRGDIIIIRLTDEEKVEQVMALYLNEEEGKVYEYYKFENGYVKDHVIYPFTE